MKQARVFTEAWAVAYFSPQVSDGATRLFMLERGKIWACGGRLASLGMLVCIYTLFSVPFRTYMLSLYGVSRQPVGKIIES